MTAKRIFWIIGVALIFLLMLAILELGKFTVWGFILTALFTGAFCACYLIFLPGAKWYFRLAAFAGWFLLFALALLISRPPVRAVPAVEGKTPEKTGIVSVEQGDLQGVISADGAVEVYAGIPYAKPPVGDLRWKEPQDPEAWEGVLAADHFAPMSMQPQNSALYDSLARIIGYHDYEITASDNYLPPVSEDSLYLNIWKPSGNAENLPVVVYIHGGSLQTGQPWYGDYSGLGLAKKQTIVVNMGYRLGVFGFYADEELAVESPNHTTGNYGLLDQIKALEWVKKNIAAFGGDPGNITLAGESAGSACVSALCTSPLAKGLFRRVVMESSTVASAEPPHSFRLFDEALASGKTLREKYGAKSIADLRALSAEALVAEADTQHHITIDGYVLTELPMESYRKGIHNEEAIFHGYNSEESAPFLLFDHANLKNYESKVRGYFGEYADEILALYPVSTNAEADTAWAEIFGATFFDYPHFCLDRLAVENRIPVYEYYFSKTNGRLGPWHSGEEIYLYGNVPEKSKLFDARDRALSAEMLAYFANFAATGDPNGEGLPIWEQNLDGYSLMSFGDTTGMTKEKKPALFAILDRMTGWEE